MATQTRASLWQVVFLASLATTLSVFFLFLGGPVLRVLYNMAGWKRYALSALLFCLPLFLVGMEPLGFFSLGLWLMVGTYGVLEARGKSGFWWAGLAVVIGVLVATVGPLTYYDMKKVEAFGELKESIGAFSRSWNGKSASGLTEEDLKVMSELTIQVLPAMISVLMMGVLGVGLIFADRFSLLMGFRYERVASEMKLLEFRVPDVLVWITMFSFLLSMLKIGNETAQIVYLNAFVFCMGAYFFQGLAVLEAGFDAFRLGFFVRFLIYVFVVAQLFFLLSILGFADFWLDLRKRFPGYKDRFLKGSEE